MGEDGTSTVICDLPEYLPDGARCKTIYRYYETKDGKPWAQWKGNWPGNSRDFILRKQTQVKPPGKGTKIHSCMACGFDMCDRCFKSMILPITIGDIVTILHRPPSETYQVIKVTDCFFPRQKKYKLRLTRCCKVKAEKLKCNEFTADQLVLKHKTYQGQISVS